MPKDTKGFNQHTIEAYAAKRWGFHGTGEGENYKPGKVEATLNPTLKIVTINITGVDPAIINKEVKLSTLDNFAKTLLKKKNAQPDILAKAL